MTANAVISVREAAIDYVRDGMVTHAVRDVSFDVAEGEFVAIVGPSGSGKSTLLNAMAGLLKPTRGAVALACDPRNIGYMFQSDALLPWRRAIDNVALTLELAGVRKRDARPKAAEVLRSLGLAGFEDRYPHELSGGMRKRVSLASALIHSPNVILMDEPYGALDAQTRLVLQEEFRRMWLQEQQTVVLVTHDLEEAVAMADRVVVLSARPAIVKRTVVVDLNRERGVLAARSDHGFSRLVEIIWQELQPEGHQTGTAATNALPDE